MNTLDDDAYKFVKKNKKEIVNKFASTELYKASDEPSFYFMAGCPGAGKTEFSKSFIQILSEGGLSGNGILRIDSDDIREIFRDKGYDGQNSDLFKRSCVKAVEILFDSAISRRLNTLFDGTLHNLESSLRNIKRALDIGASINIFYIYQDPVIAWEFSRIREKKEGRAVPKNFFIDSFFKSKDNVNKIKQEYGKKVVVTLINKKADNVNFDSRFNIDNIDNYLKIKYTSKDLEELIK